MLRIPLVLLLFVLTLLAGCDDDAPPDTGASRVPVPIEDGDECHVCGMLIAEYPGPKGEAFRRGSGSPYKFCSTRDLFAYLLQPESEAIVREVYVHDMEQAEWGTPDDTALVDARQAWYVTGQPLRGAMGPTLASFARHEAAEQFAARTGGRVLRYEDITLEVIATLDYGPTASHGTHSLAPGIGAPGSDAEIQAATR